MSETELELPESTPSDVPKQLERIKEIADAHAPEVEVPDGRALEGEDDLLITGQTWLRQELRHTKHLHYVRLFLLGALFVLVVLWLASVAALLLAVGFHSRIGFDLSDKVVIAYITSTTVSVLGLFHIAAKWLFSASFADLSRSIQDLTKRGKAH